jgi:hypothetical protein
VYESGKPALHDGHLTQTELHLYGSSRLGLLHRSVNVDTVYTADDTTMTLLGTGLNVNFGRGQKLFELNNHLGNVLVTVNDKKLGVSSNNTTIDYFNPQVVTAQDYYPYGMVQPGRSVNVDGYRFGFNGQEKSDEVAKGSTTAQFWEYDSRIGRRWNIDPRPTVGISGYNTFGGNPIWFNDVKGDTLGGINDESAIQLRTTLQETFKGPDKENLRNLFKLDGNNFAAIDEKDFVNAIKDLSLDDQILAVGYYSAVNSTKLHTVEIMTRGDRLSQKGQDVTKSWYLNGSDAESLQDGPGGNWTVLDDKDGSYMGSHTILITDSDEKLNYLSTTKEGMTSRKPPLTELAAHEIIGHGLGGEGENGVHKKDLLYAMQMNNIFLRTSPDGGTMLWRDGRDHQGFTEKPLPYNVANETPSYITSALFSIILNNARPKYRY